MEITNETRVIEKLCKDGTHPNIIVVLKHGWLNDDQRYFFDMEFCPINLDQFIINDFKTVLGLSEFLNPKSTTESDDLACLTLWNIMRHITSGLKFIHGHGELHRDLKPRNGNFISNVLTRF